MDGKVTAVLGTHTHVQTNDARIMPQGTFFISDVGACMSLHSIIGMKRDKIIRSIFMPGKYRMEASKEYPYILNAVYLNVEAGKVRDWKVINELYHGDN